ncbi:hypothetical protein [Gemmobacter serpentinus]|uniref:hypothetical protein n=1 Tax=Gemmobacter serpentinus TaxID=2652247 RepID=UPI00124EB4C5|nr:hypothetical protein [Gemmobacter serpentinus]
MRVIRIFCLIAMTFIAIASGLLAAAAITDSRDHCPGIQCSDAIQSGVIFGSAACVALIAFWLTYRFMR